MSDPFPRSKLRSAKHGLYRPCFLVRYERRNELYNRLNCVINTGDDPRLDPLPLHKAVIASSALRSRDKTADYNKQLSEQLIPVL